MVTITPRKDDRNKEPGGRSSRTLCIQPSPLGSCQGLPHPNPREDPDVLLPVRAVSIFWCRGGGRWDGSQAGRHGPGGGSHSAPRPRSSWRRHQGETPFLRWWVSDQQRKVNGLHLGRPFFTYWNKCILPASLRCHSFLLPYPGQFCSLENNKKYVSLHGR